MSQPDDAEIEETGLSEEDFQQFLLGPKALITGFLIVLAITGALLYWFQLTMWSNSELKVQQAKKILRRAENLPDKPTPLTIELEQFAQETDEERNRILKELMADSFTRRFPDRLKQRFFQRTTYLELPPDWKTKLPEKLDRWAQRQRNQRQHEIEKFFRSLETTLSQLDHRMGRIETIRKEKNLQTGDFGGDLRRYDALKVRLNNQMKEVEILLNEVELNSPKLPPGLFRNINDLVDPMSSFAMHCRNFSALSSAPAAFFHAHRILNDARRIAPNKPAPYYWLGKLYRKLELHDVASQYMARALHYDPGFKRDSILSHLRERVKREPGDPRRNYYLGFALYEAGKQDTARKYLEKVLRLEDAENTMVNVLARKRLGYLRTGEPYYSKLPLF